MIQFACYTCQKRLKVADQHAGCKSKCPACASPLIVPLESETAPPEPVRPAPVPPPPVASNPFAFDEGTSVPAAPPAPRSHDYDEPRRAAPREPDDVPEPRTSAADWKPLHTGLGLLRLSSIFAGVAAGLVFASVVVTFLFGLALVGGSMSSASWSLGTTGYAEMAIRPASPGYYRTASSDNAAAAGLGLIILFLAWIALLAILSLTSAALKFVGNIFLLLGPNTGGLRGLAIGVLATDCLAVFVYLGSFVLGLDDRLALSVGWLTMPTFWILILANHIIVLVFLWQLGKERANDRLCNGVVNYAIWWGVTVGGGVLTAVLFGLFVAAFALGSSRFDLQTSVAAAGLFTLLFLGAAGLVGFGLLVNLFVRYLNLLGQARRALSGRRSYA